MTQLNQQSALAESDAAFRSQFNPTHPSYHGGDPTPVPIGGSRVPDGLAEVPETPPAASSSSESSSSSAALPIEYHALHDLRELVGKVKAEISTISRAVGGAFNAASGTRKRSEAENGVKVVLSQLEKLLGDYKAKRSSSSVETAQDVLSAVVYRMTAMCSTIPASREAYGEFVLSTHGLTSQLFKEQNRLLQRMKEIKTETKQTLTN